MLIDKDRLIKDLHETAFKDGDDREICYKVIERQIPEFVMDESYETTWLKQMQKETEYWRKKCEDYEHTILIIAVKLAEREGV